MIDDNDTFRVLKSEINGILSKLPTFYSFNHFTKNNNHTIWHFFFTAKLKSKNKQTTRQEVVGSDRYQSIPSKILIRYRCINVNDSEMYILETHSR